MVVYTLAGNLGREDFHPVALDFLLVLASPLLDHVVFCGVEAGTRGSCLEAVYLAQQVLVLVGLFHVFKE